MQIRHLTIAWALCLWVCLGSSPGAQMEPPGATPPQVGDVSGTVRAAESGSPLPYASVTVEGTNWGAMTLEDGTFTIKNVPAGTYTLRVK